MTALGTGREQRPARVESAVVEHLRAPSTPAGSLRVCAIVPAFNESRTVAEVVGAIRRALPSAGVVVIDDGSTDDTGARALRAGAVVVSLPVNLGIGGAVQTGYLYAKRHGFDVVLQIDGDGQHDPTESGRLIDLIGAGRADVVVGSRWLGRGNYEAPSGRRIGMRILSTLVRWRTGQLITDTTSGFRAVGPRGIDVFSRVYPTDFPEVEALVTARRYGLQVEEVPVRMEQRRHGRSSIAGLRSSYYIMRVVVSLVFNVHHRKEVS